MNPLIGLLTDFGNDFAVASIKGVLLSSIPHATIVDIDHTIEKFSIISGSFVIDQVHRFFPKETFFLCIVDPGVGGERNEIYVELNGHHFVGPDNGIFTQFLKNKDVKAYRIDGASFNPPSHTFHGRDLFAPALADIIGGKSHFLTPVAPETLVQTDYTQIPQVVYIDSFGNIKTSIPLVTAQTTAVTITCAGKTYRIPFVSTFTQVPEQTLLCYKGSNNTLEIAINKGRASDYLGVHVASQLTVQFHCA